MFVKGPRQTRVASGCSYNYLVESSNFSYFGQSNECQSCYFLLMGCEIGVHYGREVPWLVSNPIFSEENIFGHYIVVSFFDKWSCCSFKNRDFLGDIVGTKCAEDVGCGLIYIDTTVSCRDGDYLSSNYRDTIINREVIWSVRYEGIGLTAQ